MQIHLAIGQASEHTKSDRDLIEKVCANDYMRCAVVEAYSSFRNLITFMVSATADSSGEKAYATATASALQLVS